MRIYKLLFFFLALISLNSCVEYVDNGVKPENGETPEEKKFVAELKETTAKYVGDRFEFKATLNGIDVTSTTKFKVDGSDIKGSHYVPFKEGSHSVIATMDDLTANFKFTVLPKEEEPEPTDGNRIEYGGNSHPLTSTIWVLNGTQTSSGIQIPNITMPDGKTPALQWLMVNYDGQLNDPTNAFYSSILVPMSGTSIVFPFDAASQIVFLGGEVVINKNSVFESTNGTFTFAATGNTQPTQNANGTANYTVVTTGTSSGNTADIFWNGEYDIAVQPLQKGKINISTITQKDFITKAQIKIVK